MENNLGYLFYKKLYSPQLCVNENIKKQILERRILDSEKVFPIEGLNTFNFKTTYPGLITGVGMPHGIKVDSDFKIGFYFDYTTGLHVITGSSIKGVLRSAFPDIQHSINKGKDHFSFKNQIDEVKAKWIIALLDSLEFPDFLERPFNPVKSISDKDIERIYSLTKCIFEGVKDYKATSLYEKFFSIYKRDVFFDAIISESGKNGKILDTDSITPHIKDDRSYADAMLTNPKPLLFLKVLPEVQFTFHFSLTENGLSISSKKLLFQKILLTLGIGAKTNVGYGQFESNEKKNNPDGSREKNNRLTEPEPFLGKVKEKAEIQAKVLDKSKKLVEANINGENKILKITGNCPDNGKVLLARVNQIKKDGSIVDVGFLKEL